MHLVAALLCASVTPAPVAMVQVPAGTFTMGCNEALDRQCLADERPAHAVTLEAFAIDRVKVSQAHYAVCVRAGACKAPPAGYDPLLHGELPANYVTWEDARDYCAFAGKRLPTEAEREYAARGGDGRVFPWGNNPPTCALATFASCSNTTTPVASHPGSASPFGAEDMAGNLWEWVADWYGPYAAQSPRAVHAKRGGSFHSPADQLRASRRWFHGKDPADDIGFRCAKESALRRP